MKNSLVMNFSVDRENKKVNVEREFAAPLSRVWAAWTESELLDQWWAPHPWKARTKTMDFRNGGYWHYAMTGPDGSEIWARADFVSIRPLKGYSFLDAFCDGDGKIDKSMPRATWTTEFTGSASSTTVRIEIKYETVADLDKIVELGFKEGFSAAMDNLDKLFEG